MKIKQLSTGCISLALCLGACRSNVATEPPITKLIPQNTPPTLTLTHEPAIIDPMGIADILVADTFLILGKNGEENIIHAYSLPQLRFLGSCQKIGGGPNEIAGPSGISQWRKKDGQVQITMHSYQTFTARLNINKSLAANETIYDEKFKYDAPKGRKSFIKAGTSYLLGDSVFLINRSFIMHPKGTVNDFFEVYDYRQDSILHSFYTTNFPEIMKDPAIDHILFDKYPVLRNDCQKLATIYRAFGMLSIVDIPTGKTKQIYTEGAEPNWKKTINEPREHYTDIQCDNQDIWLLARDNNDPDNLKSRIDIFDWEGNYLYKIELDQLISIFSIDKKFGFIYAKTTEDRLIRYNIKELLDQLP